ncbi:MAG: type II secretion system F family protein [Anaerolineae bacterium]
MSSPSSPKRNVKDYFEEISSFDLFFQLTYMSATSAAGVSRSRVFELARQLACPTAKFFKSIHEVAENLRYNYPDAVRLVGEKTKANETKTFLLRLSDALRSGEPLAAFLRREAGVQGDHYENDYMRRLESLKKWNDGYVAMTISAALIVIINMVSSMIYDLGTVAMLMMVMIAIAASFGVAWILFRSGPQETISVPLKNGSKLQRRARKLFLSLAPTSIVAMLLLGVLGVPTGLVLIIGAAVLLPIGITANKFDNLTRKKDEEIAAFFRSVGGTATSRGTTLKEAIASIKLDSFPVLQDDIRMLDLRLKSYGKPLLCWQTFGIETGSLLAKQSVGVFYEAVNLGGDPETAGNVTSDFAMKTAMLRTQRQGVGATFAWLTMVMHGVMGALMVFLLTVLEQFGVRMQEAMATMNSGADAEASLGLGNMFSFSTPQISFLTTVTIGMLFILSVINAFAITASEGSHLIKINYYLSIMLMMGGVAFIFVPPLVRSLI